MYRLPDKDSNHRHHGVGFNSWMHDMDFFQPITDNSNTLLFCILKRA